MTPEDLYYLYRFDEPTRLTEWALSTTRFFTPTPESVPIAEQCLPWSVQANMVRARLNETKPEKAPLKAASIKRRKRRQRR